MPAPTELARHRRLRSRRLLLASAAVALIGLAVALTVGLSDGRGSGSVTAAPTPLPALRTSGFPEGRGGGGIFTDRCGFSHEAADDPILMPGQPGQAMQHDFYGNTTTSASSTAASLRGKPTTCSTSGDASAYWTPVLYQDGRALQPSTALVYWRQSRRLASETVPMPAGISIIAGDETATGPQSAKVIRWTCSGVRDPGDSTTSPHACGARELRLIVAFPSCWDGHDLNGASQTNVVYPVHGRCPASHPVAIPQIVFHVNYPTASPAGLTLSMSPTMRGSVDTAHADFVNGWDQPLMARATAGCIATHRRCGPVLGSDAVPQGPAAPRR